jgi:multiple sugar transport system substrate-binding protein
MPYDASRERHLRAAPIPVMAGGHPSSVFGGWNLMVARSSTKKEAVVDFVKYLLSDSSQEVFYARGGHFPVIRSFYTDSVYRAKYPEIDGINRLMATGRHRPHQEGYTKYSKIMSRYFSLAIAGKIAVDEALDNATQAIAAEKSLVEVH